MGGETDVATKPTEGNMARQKIFIAVSRHETGGYFDVKTSRTHTARQCSYLKLTVNIKFDEIKKKLNKI